MPVQENFFKPYSEVITGSIIYGAIGVFLDRIQGMSVGLFYSAGSFRFTPDFLLPAVEQKPGIAQARQEPKISSAAGFSECGNRHMLFFGYKVQWNFRCCTAPLYGSCIC